MKRLSKFEVDCLVDVVESKLMRIEKEKLKKECGEKVKEWNKELKEILSEKRILSDKLDERIKEINKELLVNDWNGVNVYNNDCYSVKGDMVMINENKSYYGVMGNGLRSKISNEIVVNSLKGNDIDSLIDSLVDKFKS
jgi:hypothetical protein